jgi:AraC family transcriptional regulator
MEKCHYYIESNLKNQLSLEIIASEMGYSPYHFGRIFQAYFGMSVMEYVRKRRLSVSAHFINRGSKIIDAAIDFGFDTPSGYSKSFKKNLGTTPSRYASEIFEMDINELQIDQGTLMKNLRFEEQSQFLIADYATLMIDDNYRSLKDMAALWYDLDHEIESELYRDLNPDKYGTMYFHLPGEMEKQYWLMALKVENFNGVLPYMTTLEIPAAQYAVFTTPHIDTSLDPDQAFAAIIRATWQSIDDHFFQADSPYQADSEKFAFELYDGRNDSEIDPVMEIWIPIKRR